MLTNKEMQEDEILEFDSIVDPGGHNTYRIFLLKKHPNDSAFTTDELLKKGLAVEELYGDFFAADVPPTVDQQATDVYLLGERKAGRWEIPDGYLYTTIRHRLEE